MTDHTKVFEVFEASVRLLDQLDDNDRKQALRLIYAFYDVSVPFEPTESTRPYGEPIEPVDLDMPLMSEVSVYSAPERFPRR